MADRSAPPVFEHTVSVAGVRDYFDAFAQGEWERLDSSLAGQFAAACAASDSLPDQLARNRGPEGPLRAI